MDGILLVDKPHGITSHDAVDFVRKKFNIKKVGHAGTLDPIATGLLVLLLGKATKLSGSLMNSDKVYEATLKCGITTDTLDAEGKIESEKDISKLSVDKVISKLSVDKVKKVFLKFLGEIRQDVPSFSATKHKGTPLYKLARRGISVKKEPRKINIKELTIKEINLPYISFKVRCSKGTYIRQLCSDIGKELNCGAHMTALRRIKSGEFKIEDAVRLEELSENDIRNKKFE